MSTSKTTIQTRFFYGIIVIFFKCINTDYVSYFCHQCRLFQIQTKFPVVTLLLSPKTLLLLSPVIIIKDNNTDSRFFISLLSSFLNASIQTWFRFFVIIVIFFQIQTKFPVVVVTKNIAIAITSHHYQRQ